MMVTFRRRTAFFCALSSKRLELPNRCLAQDVFSGDVMAKGMEETTKQEKQLTLSPEITAGLLHWTWTSGSRSGLPSCNTTLRIYLDLCHWPHPAGLWHCSWASVFLWAFCFSTPEVVRMAQVALGQGAVWSPLDTPHHWGKLQRSWMCLQWYFGSRLTSYSN